MAIKNGIGYSPLTEKVYMGRQNPEKRVWVGEKKDITNQFIAVAFEYFEEGTIRTIGSGKGKNLFINIKETREDIEKVIQNLSKRLKSLTTIIIFSLVLFSCSDNKEKSEAIPGLVKQSYSNGYVDGANAVIDMENGNIYSHEALKMKRIVDSIEFANKIDKLWND